MSEPESLARSVRTLSRDASGSVFIVLVAAFVAVQTLLPSLASKFVLLGPLILPGSAVIFPINYIINDVLTEVYGFERSRRVIWLGLSAQVFAAGSYALIQGLPAAPFWHNQAAYDLIFGSTPRVVLASLIANLFGEFANSIVLSLLKFLQSGRRGMSQAVRFVASTIIGQLVNSVLFLAVAFSGILTLHDILHTMFTMWLFKSCFEIVVLPLTLRVSNWTKDQEGLDVIDVPSATRYNPFHL